MAVRMALSELSQNSGRYQEKASPLRGPTVRQLRQVRASMPNLRAKPRRLAPKASKVDLLDQKLTSFPDVDDGLYFIEDYFPEGPVNPAAPIDPSQSSWIILMQKKLRWRWNVTGLFHT